MAKNQATIAEWRAHAPTRSTWTNRAFRQGVWRTLENLQSGRLTIVDPDGVGEFGPANAALVATITVVDQSFYRDVALGGTLGLGESFMDGKWRSRDLYPLFRMFARDHHALSAVDGGTARLLAPALATVEWFRRNTREGSRRNIAAHYDLGNDFYKLMLDPTMMYSCAMYEHSGDSLEQASLRKIDHVLETLQVGPDTRLLEIGTGWGGLAVRAAEKFGCQVTTTTISEQQYRWTQSLIDHRGLGEQITLLKQDYRDLQGTFDRIVSIEMIEAVGHQYYGTFFEKCNDLLSDNGAMLLQAIVINDDRYADHLRTVDFIQKYIFPGSTIPSISALATAANNLRDSRLVHIGDITQHYAPTLLEWQKNFQSNLDQVRRLGFDDRFIRMWRYYLDYCAAGFKERYLGDVHLMFARQGFNS